MFTREGFKSGEIRFQESLCFPIPFENDEKVLQNKI